MVVLGMNFSHDGAIAVVKDGKLLSAIATERITRVKKDFGITRETIEYVLENAGVTLDQIDCVALADYIEKHNCGVLEIFDVDGIPIDKTSYKIYHNDVKVVDGIFLGKHLPVYILPHHLAHCAAAYYTSNFDESICFTLDSNFGELADNSMVAIGNGNKLVAEYSADLISGIGYATFTELLGFEPAYAKAGTTMGLSCYGTPLKEVTNNLDQYVDQMFFRWNSNAELEYRIYWSDVWEKLSAKHPHQLSFRESSDLAATIQLLLEESILKAYHQIANKYDSKNICLGGGSFLNCMTNSAIKKSKRHDNIHHFPACGDDGNAVGSALYVAHHIFDEPRAVYQTKDIAYLGRKQEYVDPDYERVATILSKGGIVAWFMGASEYGPRALGNRSILADPRHYHTREKINFAVKNREWFRPIAPVVLEEHAKEWFDFDGPSPYMLYTSSVIHPEKLQAVTHVDGTARHQTVNIETNEPLYNLINEFYKITGIPVLVNTSLNGNGQPILETQEQALEFFRTNDSIDAIVVNGILTEKQRN
jgi:carbamoyltransferase